MGILVIGKGLDLIGTPKEPNEVETRVMPHALVIGPVVGY